MTMTIFPTVTTDLQFNTFKVRSVSAQGKLSSSRLSKFQTVEDIQCHVNDTVSKLNKGISIIPMLNYTQRTRQVLHRGQRQSTDTLTCTFLLNKLWVCRRVPEHLEDVRYVKSELCGQCQALGQTCQRGAQKHAHHQLHSCCQAHLPCQQYTTIVSE